MPAEPTHRHNGGPLSDDDSRKLWNHIRALEVLEEQAQDIRDDVKVRKELAKKDGFDTKIIEAVLKRRKAGSGETKLGDMLTKIYEEGLEDEGVLPLEQTRIPPPPRRTPEEISQSTHGVDLGAAAAPGKEDDLAQQMREFADRFPNVTLTVVPQQDDNDPF